ncbi:MAG TPA: hydroxyphenylacetyl-CoA thioesterase PaaI [Puia sp.]|nr:hydroxyphenylacetyl-CoA thioesterase PaaI [Puia sp.]
MTPTNFKSPRAIADQMMENDRFSQWLGLEVDECTAGYCKLHYRITEDMLNGFHSVHGGILFSAADSAFAFACNSHGILTVALDVSITFTRPSRVGDMLTVEAKELYRGNKTGLYEVRTTSPEGELIALFKGTSYSTSKRWDMTDGL